MTQDDIIRMAREACDPDKVEAWQNGFWTLTQEELERFAAAYAAAALTKTTPNAWQEAVQDRLVVVHGLTDENANDPREAIADLIRIETQIALDPTVSSDAHALIAAGAAAEREACAKVCDELAALRIKSYCAAEAFGAEDCAVAVRTRSEK